jgi:hypothetical protein
MRFDPFNPVAAAGMTDHGLEDFITFAIFVAGKPASRTRLVVDAFYEGIREGEGPMAYAKRLADSGDLDPALRRVKSGQYARIGRALDVLSRKVASGELRLRECSLDDLESVPGIGMKTSRFFLMYSRGGGTRCAVLDTHVLRWLRDRGVEAPASTPTSRRKYEYLESKFLEICGATGNRPDQLDFKVWNSGATRPKPAKMDPCHASATSKEIV